MPKQPTLVEMLEAGMHFGHQTSRWHPKMDQYIFGERGGIHIIDLERTQELLPGVLEVLEGIASRGGKILFVGTKKQAQEIIKKYADECDMPYVINRWLGGTITNFAQIKHSLKRLLSLKEQRDKGELRKYTKKEQLLLSREIEDLERKVGGIQNMTKIPEAIFVMDIRMEKTAVEEASRTGVKVIAVCDSNVNPSRVDHVIPANDDAVRSIEMIMRLASEAIIEGSKKAVKAAAAKATKPAEDKKDVKETKGE